jgi:uncharacterized membrane protein
MAGWLLHLGARRDRVVLRCSGVIIFVIATVFAVGCQAIFLNPVMPFLGSPVEGWFLLDSLFLAYAIPAMLYAALGFYRLGPRVLWQAALVLAAGFAFLWVTLEVRHFFQGDHLNQGFTGEAEWYAYSAAWLAFAAAGLGAALKWRSSGCAGPRCSASAWSSAKCFCPTWPISAGLCGRCPSSVSARFWLASATPIGGCSHCRPTPNRPRKK